MCGMHVLFVRYEKWYKIFERLMIGLKEYAIPI